MGLKDALFLLESLGLSVKISGHGTVRKQDIKSGTSLKNVSTVELILSHKN